MSSHSSRPAVTDGLQRPTRTRKRRATPQRVPIWPCSQRGLPGRFGYPNRRCALTAPFHLHQRASPLAAPPPPTRSIGRKVRDMTNATSRLPSFCGTFLRLTPTGSYPALCPTELGLSSRRLQETTSDCQDCRPRRGDRARIADELQADMRSFAPCTTNCAS